MEQRPSLYSDDDQGEIGQAFNQFDNLQILSDTDNNAKKGIVQRILNGKTAVPLAQIPVAKQLMTKIHNTWKVIRRREPIKSLPEFRITMNSTIQWMKDRV